MIQKFRTRFSLIQSGKNSEEKQIHIVCTVNKIEIFYYIGYRVNPANFIKSKSSKESITYQHVKKNTFNKTGDAATRINTKMKQVEIAAQNVYDKYFKNCPLDTFSKDNFKKQLQIELGEISEENLYDKECTDIFDLYDKYIESRKKVNKYNRHFQSDKNKLQKYSDEINYELTTLSIDLNDYKIFLNKSRTNNTVVTIMKRLRTFYNWLKSENIIDKSPFDNIKFTDKIGSEIYQEPICMTREELTQLYDAKMKTKHKEVVKDMFCLQASLGCRVGDFIRLTYDNIQNGQLIYFPKKTSEFADKVVVPLSKRAEAIINKYKGHDRKNLIMPFMNAVEYNKTLKNVFEDAKLNRKIIIYDRENKKENFKKLHEMASSHLARRTFVDILCQAGEPIHVVASMSGHSENSKAFDRYRRRPEQLQKQAVSRSMD